MRVLVIGSGGREHAICQALARSKHVERLYAAPGNPGIATLAGCIPLPLADHPRVIAFCQEQQIDLVFIGPEAPLVAGLADDLVAANIRVLGPSKAAAELEASKAFTKQLCDEASIPTARYLHTSDPVAAKAFVQELGYPVVIKADGLAAGKGVVIASTQEEADATIDDFLSGSLGAAGSSLVVEEYLQGTELSFFALCDGTTALPFGSAVDHKRIGEGDTGANTGGMGTISPAPQMTPALEQQIMEHIIHPTLEWMSKRGTPFRGFLFAGLMLTQDGPKLLEYNVRLGDPETQSLLQRLESDFAEVCQAAAEGRLQDVPLQFSTDTAVCIVMAAQGYPGDYVKHTEIQGVEAAEALGCTVIHAGTVLEDGKLYAIGGRVLGICAKGTTLSSALTHAYQGVSAIHWPEGYYRRDIGAKFL